MVGDFLTSYLKPLIRKKHFLGAVSLYWQVTSCFHCICVRPYNKEIVLDQWFQMCS